MATKDTQTRKVGDTLRLSGQLTGDALPPDDADWVGATGRIHIVKVVNATTFAPYRDEAVILDAATAPRRYQYEGAPPATEDVGSFLYEIQVTFSDLTVTTFPNNRDKYRLRIVPELG